MNPQFGQILPTSQFIKLWHQILNLNKLYKRIKFKNTKKTCKSFTWEFYLFSRFCSSKRKFDPRGRDWKLQAQHWSSEVAVMLSGRALGSILRRAWLYDKPPDGLPALQAFTFVFAASSLLRVHLGHIGSVCSNHKELLSSFFFLNGFSSKLLNMIWLICPTKRFMSVLNVSVVFGQSNVVQLFSMHLINSATEVFCIWYYIYILCTFRIGNLK